MQKNSTLTATNIKYLIAIYNLGGKEKFVKCTDIAGALGVTRPSVHAMIKTLTERQLITKPRYGKVSFTPFGYSTAEKYIKCYNASLGYLKDIIPHSADCYSAVCAFISRIPRADLDSLRDNITRAGTAAN